MVALSLMFRVFTASRQAQLKPSTTFLRSVHSTTSLRSAAGSVPKVTPTDSVSVKPKEVAHSSASTSFIDQTFYEAIDGIVKAPKPKRSRPRKLKSEESSQHGDGKLPKKPARSRRKAVSAAVATSESVSTAPELETAATPQKRRPRVGRPKIEAPEDPRSNLKKYLQWGFGGNWEGGKAVGDRKRMNVISEDACDAILKRMKPSLERHKGCDIIDINPGVGVWSSKLHDFLKPRTHILLEPDIRLCGPLLEPLVKAPDSTYKLVPRSGLVWGHLESVLNEDQLPHQIAYPRDDPRLEERNDTLLVTANLGYHPKKPYKGFSSLAQMVIYQFMGSIKAHSLFQKYGLVRMLVWINDEERHNIVPRTMASRRKGSAEAVFACEKLEEVASGTAQSGNRTREVELDLQVAWNVLQKMRAKGIEIPKGRESFLMQQLFSLPDAETRGAFRLTEELARGEYAALKKLEVSGQEVDRGRLTWLKIFLANDSKQQRRVTALSDEYEEIVEAAKATQDLPNSEEKDVRNADFEERMAAWEENVDKLSGDRAGQVRLNCENRLAVKREKPLLLWDRREIEPLKLEPEEFCPAKTMCLFDIQPKTLIPVLRKDYPNNYDVLEYLLVSFYTMPAQSVKHGLTGLVPGALEWIEAECPSLKDVRKGGNPDLDRLTVRSLSEEMLVEMVEAWIRWPFKPTKYEMLSRMGSATHDASAMEGDETGPVGMH
ncbi:S-adenosyl-L-methionine-dependent methyltransferase [Cadophora sp. DSE1049]|nr:S-adenosyl-L-methionine-dependent methyltransferase [Cadophora sp. DSE1049]